MDNSKTLELNDSQIFADTWARKLVLSRLRGLQEGQLRVNEGGEIQYYGSAQPLLKADIKVYHPDMYRKVVLGGVLGAAESYMDGDWDSASLTEAIQVLLRNRGALDSFESGAARLGRALARWYHSGRKNSVQGSKRNIAAHYDLGNDFFERMLDPTMSYSAAVFEAPEQELEAASITKIDLLCRKLSLSPEDHLLEIGTGWGAFAIHAAKNYGCRVTTTTISAEQHQYAKQKIKEASLADKITLLQQDYRELSGQFDKIVSVEMIEAVGAEFYPTFFGKLEKLIKPGGMVALQAITMTDQYFEKAKHNADFIKRYIFPGSCIPSITALLNAATQSSGLVLHNMEDLTPNYAETLKQWRLRLAPHQAWVSSRYGNQFWRMWNYYLCYCEAGFLEHYIGSAHLVFQRPRFF